MPSFQHKCLMFSIQGFIRVLMFQHREPVSEKTIFVQPSKLVQCYVYYIHSPATLGRYTLLGPGLDPFCLQNCLNSSWHRFNKALETFLRDFPYFHESITQLLQICRLHIHDANLPFHHIPKVFYWIEIWWLWRPLEYSELIVMFKKPVWDDLSFVTWHVILLEVAIRRWVHCGHKGMDIVSNNTQVGCGV